MAKPQPSYFVVTTEGSWDKVQESLEAADSLPAYPDYVTPIAEVYLAQGNPRTISIYKIAPGHESEALWYLQGVYFHHGQLGFRFSIEPCWPVTDVIAEAKKTARLFKKLRGK